jgi:hypothetical protein
LTGKQVAKRIAFWSKKLGTDGWQVRYSLIPADEEHRASTTPDGDRRRAVIQISADCPDSQVDREIVHELLHVLLYEANDLFERSVGDHQPEAREFLRGQWRRSVEWPIERLVDALTGIPFGQFGIEHNHEDVWASAFPVD